MVKEKVVRVECNTCGGVHNYYPPVETKKTPSVGSPIRKKEPVPRKTRIAAGAAEQEEWEAVCAAVDREQALLYDINGKYQVNDLIEHPTFGLGIVKAVIKPNKMEVLFREGKKLLRCSG